jgi:hypothetical protein
METRKTDWVCSNCHFLIFGRKNKCGKCGTLKPIVNNLKNIENKESQDMIWAAIIEEKSRIHSQKMATDPEYYRIHTELCRHGDRKVHCWKCN